MVTRTVAMDEAMRAYLHEITLRETEVMTRLRAETARLTEGDWQVSPEQGQLLEFLVELTGARSILEIGTFTGYSALRMAHALPPDGRLVTLDMMASYTDIARRYWAEAGVVDRIELRLGAATESLASLLAEGRAASFDFVYIDANKKDYDAYYEAALGLTRPGGLIAIDNVFWHGRVLDAGDDAKSTRAIRALNKKIHADERVGLSVIPIGDGLTLVCKRG